MCLIDSTLLYNIYCDVVFSEIICLPELNILCSESSLDPGLTVTLHVTDTLLVIAEVQENFGEKQMSTKNVSTVCAGSLLNVSIITSFYETN